MIENLPLPIVLDEDNPWPALSPFDETGQRFFNGRRDEIAALQRAVLQAPLTVLFGKSGLGKTSLLKAGLFPKLRDQKILPVYVRLNVQDHVRPLIEQLATAFHDEVTAHTVDAPALAESESLWHYLHRRDLEIWSIHNQVLIPLFVLDQFEEVFTLGVDNAAAIAQFQIDLADVIENRIPASLVAQNEEDDAATAALDLQCQRYKVLLSFREDFLPVVESWKREMPSLLRNRVRLLPMNGEQAFAAIHDTAPKLADPSIAADIVHFVATAQLAVEQAAASAGQDQRITVQSGMPSESTALRDLIVEPALLSLLCDGLNKRRKKEGKPAFDRGLLEGTGQAIIEEFYRRSLSDLPARVQRFIENELITERGFRKACAIDDARMAYGVTDEELRTLVNRRLLRIEPYQGIERVELIHDVLTSIVRQERERQRECERQAAVEAESAKQRQRQRVRLLTGGSTVLVVVLLGVGYLAFWAFNQKMLAEARQMAAVGVGRLDIDPELAALIALESLNVKGTGQGESLLRQALARTALSVLRGQEQTIHNVAFSSDARRLATASEDGSVWVWDVKTSQVLHRLDHGQTKVRVVKFSPNGKLIATASDNGHVWIWDEDTGEKIRVLSLGEQTSSRTPQFILVGPDVASIVFDSTGQWLAAGGALGIITLWDLRDYSLKREFDTKSNRPIVSVTFSTNERKLIAANDDGQIYSWQFQGHEKPSRRSPLKLDGLPLKAFAPSPDGKHLVIAAGREDPKGLHGGAKGSVKIIDAATGSELRELRGGHNGAVLDAAFSSDGRMVITSASDSTICVWDAENGDLKRVMRGHVGPVRTVSVAGDNSVFASGGDDKTVRIWSVAALPSMVLKGHQRQATAVAFSPDGRWLVSGGSDKTVRIWRTVDGTAVHTLSDHKDAVYIVAVSPDGRLIASGGGGMLFGHREGDTAIRLWDPKTGELLMKIQENHVDVLGAAFTPDGRELATTGNESAARFWDVATGRLIREFKWEQEANGVWLALSPDRKYVAVAGSDGVARVWDYKSGRLIWNFSSNKKQLLTSSLFGDNGKLLMTTTLEDPEIIVWDVIKGVKIRSFKGYTGANLADLSRDGTLAVTADFNSSPWLWDVRTGTPLISLYPGAGAWGVAFSADGRRIATTTSVGEIYLWDCIICAPIDELRRLAEKRIGRTLTSEELRRILGE